MRDHDYAAAQEPDHCTRCAGPVEIGDPIVWTSDGAEVDGLFHEECWHRIERWVA